MLVKEIMTKNVITIDPAETVLDAATKYRDYKVGCLVVTDTQGHCVGIVTERDLIERTICMGKNPEQTRIDEIMSSEVKTVNALDTIERALTVMREHHIKKLPVTLQDEIVGIITVTDISKARPELSERFIDSWVKPRWVD